MSPELWPVWYELNALLARIATDPYRTGLSNIAMNSDSDIVSFLTLPRDPATSDKRVEDCPCRKPQALGNPHRNDPSQYANRSRQNIAALMARFRRKSGSNLQIWLALGSTFKRSLSVIRSLLWKRCRNARPTRRVQKIARLWQCPWPGRTSFR